MTYLKNKNMLWHTYFLMNCGLPDMKTHILGNGKNPQPIRTTTAYTQIAYFPNTPALPQFDSFLSCTFPTSLWLSMVHPECRPCPPITWIPVVFDGRFIHGLPQGPNRPLLRSIKDLIVGSIPAIVYYYTNYCSVPWYKVLQFTIIQGTIVYHNTRYCILLWFKVL